jgi:hypothetical protein
MESGKPKSEELIESYQRLYPNIRVFALTRFSGEWKNVYLGRTHKPRPPIRDHSEAACVLVVAEWMGIEAGRPLQFSQDELKALNKIGTALDPHAGLERPNRRKKGKLTEHGEILAWVFGFSLLLPALFDFWQ